MIIYYCRLNLRRLLAAATALIMIHKNTILQSVQTHQQSQQQYVTQLQQVNVFEGSTQQAQKSQHAVEHVDARQYLYIFNDTQCQVDIINNINHQLKTLIVIQAYLKSFILSHQFLNSYYFKSSSTKISMQIIQIFQSNVPQYNTFNMSITNILCLFLLAAIAITSPLSQNQVDDFVRGANLVPPTAVLKDFKDDHGKSIINYEDQFTVYKFVVAQGQDGKPFILFRHQITQINLSNNGIENPIQEINFIPNHPVFQFQPMPLIQIPPEFTNNFNQQMLSGVDVPAQKMRGRHGQRHGQRHGTKGRGFRKWMGGRERGCRINEQEVKMLLKQNLVIFRNAQIQKIEKIGFQRGAGIILSITLQNEGKEFNVQAGYMPRWNKLNVLKIVENNNPIEVTPKETEDSNPIIEQAQPLRMQSIIQSFIEKLLIRKSFDLGTKQHPPIIVGNEGQSQNPTILQFEAPILLGAQGQVENPTVFNQPPFLLGKQGEPENHLTVEKPLMLGNEGEPENNYRFVQRKQPIEKVEKVEKVEQNEKQQVASQQISDIVTDVLSKLKLKKK